MSERPDEGWMDSMSGPMIGGADDSPLVVGFPAQFRTHPYAGEPSAAGPLASAGAGSGGGGSAGGGLSHGLNVPVCRDISYGLAKDADDLERIGEDAEVSVRRILDVWDGEDAERFRVRWLRSQRELDEATTSLRNLRRGLELAVDQQEAASRH